MHIDGGNRPVHRLVNALVPCGTARSLHAGYILSQQEAPLSGIRRTILSVMTVTGHCVQCYFFNGAVEVTINAGPGGPLHSTTCELDRIPHARRNVLDQPARITDC